MERILVCSRCGHGILVHDEARCLRPSCSCSNTREAIVDFEMELAQVETQFAWTLKPDSGGRA